MATNKTQIHLHRPAPNRAPHLSEHTPEDIKRGSLSHRILMTLSTYGALVPTAIRRAGDLSIADSDLKFAKLPGLAGIGLVRECTEDHQRGAWEITEAGVGIRIKLGDIASLVKSRHSKAKKAEIYTRPLYVPHELGRTCMRPGAYDAFKLPSRMADGLYYRDGSVKKFPTEVSTLESLK